MTSSVYEFVIHVQIAVCIEYDILSTVADCTLNYDWYLIQLYMYFIHGLPISPVSLANMLATASYHPFSAAAVSLGYTPIIQYQRWGLRLYKCILFFRNRKRQFDDIIRRYCFHKCQGHPESHHGVECTMWQ